MNVTDDRPPHRAPAGAAPGTITVAPDAAQPRIEVISYGSAAEAGAPARVEVASIRDIPELPPQHGIRWVNVTGLGDEDVLRDIGERFEIHELALEDIAGTSQRPKVESYGNFLFIVARVPAPAPEVQSADVPPLRTEQLALCVGRDFVITFHESAAAVLAPVRRRLLAGGSTMRKRGPDYLAYAILDSGIDAYFPVLENCGEHVEGLEAEVIDAPSAGSIGAIHSLKRSLLTARRAVWPLREVVNSLIRDESPFMSRQTRVFLRDCYDHVAELLDIIETYREVATGLVDILLSSQSNRMNEIMKVLTIIATIFIPLSWLTGLYGMNFDPASPWNMPELSWRFGYFYALGLMLAVAGLMVIWFRRKGWIGGSGK